MMKGKLPVKPLDVVIILLALALTGFSAFTIYVKPRSTVQVLIEGQNQKWIFPLDAEETVVVQGPLGNTVVKIHDHQAWVESSPCKNQICVAAGHLHELGEYSACLPNNVFLVIEGNDDFNQLDSTAW